MLLNMYFILISISISILISILPLAGPGALKVNPSCRVMAACSIVMLLYLANTQALYDFCGFRLMLSAMAAVLFFRFFSSSHHYIISPDILSRFSLLLLILKQNLKIAHPSLQIAC